MRVAFRGATLFVSMKKVALHTLGCKLNFAETASIGREFARRGFQIVAFGEQADVVVLNTCTVTEKADRECRQMVRRALRRSPDAFIVVAGCYAQLQPGEIASIEGVDLVLGSKEKADVFAYAGDFQKREAPAIHITPAGEIVDASPAVTGNLVERTRAFLKIQDGCDYNCSFCTIPRARGGSRSVPVSVLVGQAEQLVRDGYREIVLTGVNVGDYGRHEGSSLRDVLRAVSSVDGVERLRVSSIEPNLLTDELLDFWLSKGNISNHFHMPLQAGSNAVLGMMRRRYRREWYGDRVRAIKSRFPDAGIGADVIVGFPGETVSDFGSTFEFISDLPVSYLHVFSYSERPNTDALALGPRVEARVRASRSERLRMLGLHKRRLHHESFVGRDVEVLFEAVRSPGWISGLTKEYVRVDVSESATSPNVVRWVHVTGATVDGCVGILRERL